MEERVRENMKREPSQIPARALMVQISESEVHPFKKSTGVNTINMYIFRRSKAKGALPPPLPVLPFLAPYRDVKLLIVLT